MAKLPSRLNQDLPFAMRLEPRLMFDGAAVDTAAETLADAGSDDAGAAVETATLDIAVAYGEVANGARTADRAVQDFIAKASPSELFALFSGGKGEMDAAFEAQVTALKAAMASGEFDVKVEYLGLSQMGIAAGAFAAAGVDGEPVIYLNRDWLEAGADEASVARVLAEELGHAIDFFLNDGADTAGDEGERFAAAVFDGGVNASVDAAADSDDHATLEVDGESIDVELASFNFINAYQVTNVADKETNLHEFDYTAGLGAVGVNDGEPSQLFSGNDVSAIGINIGGIDYFGWISRPIKATGQVRGFYFWTDANFTDLASAVADGNTDSDSSTADNSGFILVVDQAYFDGLAFTTGNLKEVGSSSDRVDSALNSLVLANVAPTANPDTQTIAEDSGNAVGNVLDNDTDADGDNLSVTEFVIGGQTYAAGATATIAGVGTLQINSDGVYTFTPDPNYNGTVPVATYVVSDGQATTTSTLTITVTPVNDPPVGGKQSDNTDDTGNGWDPVDARYEITTPEDTPYDGVVSAYDADGDSLTYTKATDPTNGTVVVNADGTYTYTPDPDYNGDDEFTVTVDDGNGGTTTITVFITVTPVNDAPVANPDTSFSDGAQPAIEASGNNNTTPGQDATGNVLTSTSTGDTDVDGDPLSVTFVGASSANIAVPAAGSNTAAGNYGTLTMNSDGSYSYAINPEDAAAVDALLLLTDTLTETFYYTVDDGNGGTATTTLTITIQGANDNPVALDDFGTAKESLLNDGTEYTGADPLGYEATGNVLNNDGDVDNGTTALEATLVGGTPSLTTELTFSAPPANVKAGYYVFTNNAGSAGTALLDSGGNQVQVSANYTGGSAVTLTGTPTNVTLNNGDILYFASKPDGSASGGTATVQSVTTTTGGAAVNGTYGTLVMNTDGSYTYTPFVQNAAINDGDSVQETFDYTITDAGNVTVTATLTITVLGSGTNDPNAVNDAATAVEAGVAAGSNATGDLLANDTTPVGANAVTGARAEGDTALTAPAAGTITVTGLYGTLTITDLTTGAFTYAVDNANAVVDALQTGESLVENFYYEIQNGQVGTGGALKDVAQLTITIDGANDAPTLDLNSGDVSTNYTTTFTEDGAAAALSTTSGITLSDVDDALFDSVSIALTQADFSNGADESLVFGATSITNLGGLADAATGTVTVGATTYDYSVAVVGGVATITFTGSGGGTLTTAEAEALIDAASYANAAQDPTTAPDRVFTFVATDAQGQASNAATATVSLTAVNDPPVLDLDANDSSTATGADYRTTYTVGDPGVAIADVDTSITDVDNTFIASATITLTNAKVGDLLVVNGGALNNITAGGDDGIRANADGTLTITLTGNGSATLADFEAAIEAITYETDSADGTDRVLTVVVNDGTDDSNTATSTIVVGPDDRALTVSSNRVNEASPYAVFTVGGAVGQRVYLALGETTGGNDATLGLDTGNAGTGVPLQYFDGVNWVDYTPGSAVTLTGPTLLVRTAIRQDSAFEDAESYELIASNDAGSTFAGTGEIVDDGTGDVFLADNNTGTPNADTDPGYPANLDDDRPLTVNDIEVNEGSPYGVFTVTGVAGQLVQLDINGNTATADTDFSSALEYWDGAAWQSYTPGSFVAIPGVSGTAGSPLYVRTAITNDGTFEGAETMTLTATNTGGTGTDGFGTILDDGAGVKYPDGDPTGGPPTDNTNLDDDRPLSVTGFGPVNEGSQYAMFEVTGQPGYALDLALGNTAVGTDTDATTAGFTFEYSVDGGTTWVSTSGPTTAVPTSGTVWVRVDIQTEQDAPFEGPETFELLANYALNDPTPVSATTTIIDDGSGTKYPGTIGGGTPGTDTTGLDDDRAISVTPYGPVNEGSQYAMFEITAEEGYELDLSLGNTADPTDTDATIGGFTYEYSTDGGATWNTSATKPTVPAGGKVWVRVDISTEQDAPYEGAETFELNAAYSTNTNNTAGGTTTIIDDGTGTKYPGTVGGGTPGTDTTGLDDDRPLTVTGPGTVNEGSPYAIFEVTSSPGVLIDLTLGNTADPTDTDADPSGFSLEVSTDGGLTWTPATSATVPPGGSFLVRIDIQSEADDVFEGPEVFELIATNRATPSVTSSAPGTIIDDGTGVKYPGTTTGGVPDTDTNDLDDDRPVDAPPQTPPQIPPMMGPVPPVPPVQAPPSFAPPPDAPAGPPDFSPLLPPAELNPLMGAGLLSVQRDIPLQQFEPVDGQVQISFTIPADTFGHTDARADISLSAIMVDGSELPGWLLFDDEKGEFRGVAPEGYEGVLEIRVLARDNTGQQVETMVRIEVTKQGAVQRDRSEGERDGDNAGQGEANRAADGQGRDQAAVGKPALVDEFAEMSVFAWKAERDALIEAAHALDTQRAPATVAAPAAAPTMVEVAAG